MKNPRSLWRPKRPEVKEQCASCPFREGNDAEFGAVLEKIARSHGNTTTITPAVIQHARLKVIADLQFSGDFVCHHTVYGPGMDEKRDPEERRQCKGATAFFRGEDA